MLDRRLQVCADLVSGEGIACDVGTDHALLAAELINSGKCERVIASDVKEGPLESARKTVEKCGISGKVELVLSDGLENIDMHGVTDVVIAGMGGETIVEILGNFLQSVEDHSLFIGDDDENEPRSDFWDDFCSANLILQPMTKPELLRKWLNRNWFDIVSEHVIEDHGKFYVVIQAKKHPFEQSETYTELTEFEALTGTFDNDDSGAAYRKRLAGKLTEKAEHLEAADQDGHLSCERMIEAEHCRALAHKLELCTEKSANIGDIFCYLNEKYPFNIQEKWDNSGLLIGSNCMKVRKILLALDATDEVAEEARLKGAELIITHHPVIFDPIKRVSGDSTVYKLIRNGTAVISMHTNLDFAENGINAYIARKIKDKLPQVESLEPLMDPENRQVWGYAIYVRADHYRRGDIAELLKNIFGCERIRANVPDADDRKLVTRIAVCSGSGGSMLDFMVGKNCDIFVTGDVKHDVWIKANNCGVTIFDCGHFDTENIILPELRRVLERRFPEIDIEIAESSKSPYIFI